MSIAEATYRSKRGAIDVIQNNVPHLQCLEYQCILKLDWGSPHARNTLKHGRTTARYKVGEGE